MGPKANYAKKKKINPELNFFPLKLQQLFQISYIKLTRQHWKKSLNFLSIVAIILWWTLKLQTPNIYIVLSQLIWISENMDFYNLISWKPSDKELPFDLTKPGAFARSCGAAV